MFAVIRRATSGKGVATADKQHLHHRLMHLGHGHRRTVVILWAWTGLLSCFVLIPAFTSRGNGIVPIGLLAFALLLFTLLGPRLGRGDAAPAGEQPGADDSSDDGTGTRDRNRRRDSAPRHRGLRHRH